MGSKVAESYRASDIEVLEGLEPVRKRPGMYIGGTDKTGLVQLVSEILDNAVDEAMNGYANKIVVTLHRSGDTISVADNGRGIPVGKHPKYKRSALELILTTLHAGGKFSDKNYISSGGLHGVGASVVNALSDRLEAVVWRDGKEWRQAFSRGKPLGKVKSFKAKGKKRGTQITFKPDPEVFPDIKFPVERIRAIIEEKAFLNGGLELHFVDEASGTREIFKYENGLEALIESHIEKNRLKQIGGDIFCLKDLNGDIRVELAFAWTEATSFSIKSFVNGICTKSGGYHEDGFKSGLSKAIRNYMSVHDLIPKGVSIIGDDIREGLIAAVSAVVPVSFVNLQFQGQTKDRLNNPEVAQPVEQLARSFENLLNAKPSQASLITDRILLSAKARIASRSASLSISRRVSANHKLNLPGKLADCTLTKADKCELFIVEGDSAGGSAKQARDRSTQAVLPLRGKILNAISSPSSKVLENKEISNVITALGCGAGDALNLAKLRYGKVIILTDADADGMHIASLLIAFFYTYMRGLVENGHLYIGLCPLYRLKCGSGKNEKTYWVRSDEEKDRVLKKIGKKAVTITRFKGLGEMNPESLWETTMNPKSRTLLRVFPESMDESERVLNDLLGKDASARYRF
ncbi:MAG: type IIA DNA topoisomerase subunit B, partial [Candidatus Dadabacteria bacterium]